MPVPKTELGYVPNDGWDFCLFGTKCLRVGQKIPSKPSQAPGQGWKEFGMFRPQNILS